jgi:cytochrome bd ubiquinol oxidase subunit II
MVLLWFWIIAAMLAIYAVLDGFDIGAGIIHLFVARDDTERRLVLRSIGPVWNGNEVWLIAAGGALFLGFPALYAESFSGFYLPLTLVLWLLIVRGVSIEFRSLLASPVWSPFWDVAFAASSAALAGVYGVAIGNVVRGVPIGQSGSFFLPLWTNLRVGPQAGVIDWFTVLVGFATVVAMAEHGALWVAMKTGGDLAQRCRRFANYAWWMLVLFTALVAAAGPYVQPHLIDRIESHKWGFIFPALAIAGLAGTRRFKQSAAWAFGCSSLYMVAITVSIAFGLYPYVLPSTIDPGYSLSIYNAAAPPMSLYTGILWFIPGIALAAIYLFIAYRSFGGKAELDQEVY